MRITDIEREMALHGRAMASAVREMQGIDDGTIPADDESRAQLAMLVDAELGRHAETMGRCLGLEADQWTQG